MEKNTEKIVNQNVGITESSEIAFNLDAFDRLYDANIIITKRLTNKLIDKIVENVMNSEEKANKEKRGNTKSKNVSDKKCY